jgi:predicted phage tail protein
MTTVTLHGILAKEFQETFNLNISSPKEVFDAISCTYANFRHRIVDLSRDGIHFTMLINGKRIEKEEELHLQHDQPIDLVPVICGAGKAGTIVAVIALGVITGGAGLALGLGSVAGSALFSFGVGLAMMGVQMALAPKPKMERPSADVSASKQSFNFSSKANVAEQGIPVPVGYGRLRVGSAVIQSSIKSFPQAFEEKDIFTQTSITSQARVNTKQ